ncbi:MAG: hypothetical protein K5895_06310, partial [Lachnospiraceae bacterium]|nr:hypothetical protein [Lachnospiraceae bacterium]
IAKAAIEHAKKHGNDLVFLDTTGRLHIDEDLMNELCAIRDAVEPAEILLVVRTSLSLDFYSALIYYITHSGGPYLSFARFLRCIASLHYSLWWSVPLFR